MSSKRTMLYDRHLALNAKLSPFAGYDMPIYYTSIKEEHLAVRQRVGLFDVSHMGEFIVKGKNAKAFLTLLTPNNVEKIQTGKAQYSLLLKESGMIIDDILIYGINVPEEYMLVVNASNIEKDKAWILQYKPQDVLFEDISDRMSLLALQGKQAHAILKKLCKINLESLSPFSFIYTDLGEVKNVMVSTTGYTGEPGFELYLENAQATLLWDVLMHTGKDFGLLPTGLGCRDTLRLEMGYPLYGNDITEQTNPKEAALSWVLKNGENHIGKQALSETIVTRTRVGFILKDRGIVRSGQHIYDKDKNMIGTICSASFSPSLEQVIGMAYIPKTYAQDNQLVWIEHRGSFLLASLARFPFLKTDHI